MRIFIHYNKDGKILSVARVDHLAKNLEQPFVLADKNESVLQLKPDDPAAKLASHEIHDGYKVDVRKKKLTKKLKKKSKRRS